MSRALDFNDIRRALEASVLVWRPDLNVASGETPLNVSSYVPRTVTFPSLFIEPSPSKTTDDIQAMSSRSAKWYFHIQVHIAHLDEEAAQAECGRIRTPLVQAVNRAKIPHGYAQVTSCTVGTATAQNQFYAHARLDVTVMA